jgi:hypothetical protein
MAKTKISEYDATAGNNTDINSINIDEGCSPSGINNAIRAAMSHLKNFQTGTSGDNLTVGGNLSVTGTSTLTGDVTAPTQSPADNTTKVATTAFVTAAATAALAADNTWTGTQTFKDDKLSFVDGTDVTKKLALELSGITTATTRTLTVPNKSGTIATTSDLVQNTPLNAASNTVVSGSYSASASTTITITATNTFAANDTVFITFTNTSGSALTAGDFTIVTASGSSFTITYGSSVTSAGTCVSTRYALIALASSSDVSARTNTLRAITPSALTITSATAQATTSGTTIDFTGIPNWVKRITIMFNNVSLTGTEDLLIQLGSTTFTTTGYQGGCSVISTGISTTAFTTGFGIIQTSAGQQHCGALILNYMGSNIWTANGSGFQFAGTNRVTVTGGSVTIGGTLDRVRITRTGTDTFDNGSVNISYE